MCLKTREKEEICGVQKESRKMKDVFTINKLTERLYHMSA